MLDPRFRASKASQENSVDRRIPAAEAYVATRFFPPLPREYGALLVTAIDRFNSGDETPVQIPLGLPVHPRTAYVGPDDDDGRETWLIAPFDLVDALRVHHLIDDDAPEA